MSNRSRRDAAARAEARRRARLQARGLPVDDQQAQDETEADERRAQPEPGGFLTRLFPPAPPLPNKPDPLRSFTYGGPLRGLVAALYLLARNPLTWILAGAIWAIGRLFTDEAAGTVVSIVASLVSFGALIAAGWFGWQRPWLFGLAAGVLGWLIFVAAVLTLGGAESPTVVPPQASESAPASAPASAVSPDAASPAPPAISPGASPGTGDGGDGEPSVGLLVQAIAIQTVFQMVLGAAAGWYGGYLRRRLASAPSAGRDQRQRRR